MINTVKVEGRLVRLEAKSTTRGKLVIGNLTQRNAEGTANLTIQLVAFSPEAQVALESLDFNVSDGDKVTTGILVVEGTLSTLFDKRPESALAGKPRSAPQTRIIVDDVYLKADMA